MATTTVSDAVVVPQARGTGLSSEDDRVDAATAALLASNTDKDEYVAEGMAFTRDDTSNEIDIGSGYCFVIDDSSSTAGSRGAGGNPQVQSTGSSGYDTEIPVNQLYLVVFPSTVSVSVTDNTLSTVWVNITDVGTNNAVEVRSSSGGGTTAAPTDTFLELGEVNDSGTGNPSTRPNDAPDLTVDSLSVYDSQSVATALTGVVASGQVTLSSGSATIDTGVSEAGATLYPALGVVDPNADVKVAARLFWDDSAGTHHVEFVEDGTSVGNPTINYDILRVQ